jgi:hypothetical protein
MPDYGSDLSCSTDIDPLMRLVSGTELMAQVALHRVYCRQGRLLSNPIDNTIDARDFLSQGITPSDLPRIQAQCMGAILGDPRIFTCLVSATFTRETQTLTLEITGTGANGPFALRLAVTALTIEVLRP